MRSFDKDYEAKNSRENFIRVEENMERSRRGARRTISEDLRKPRKEIIENIVQKDFKYISPKQNYGGKKHNI